MNNNPFDRARPPVGINNNLSQESIRAHERDDLDSGSNAHHHSLGPGPNQAAAGDLPAPPGCALRGGPGVLHARRRGAWPPHRHHVRGRHQLGDGSAHPHRP